MNILQVIPYFTPEFGGSAEACFQLSKALCNKGHSIRVYTSDAGYSRSQFSKHDGLSVHYLATRFSLAQFYFTIPGIVCQQLCSWADIIHMHNFRSYQNVQTMRKGKPYILQPHGSLATHGRRTILKSVFDKVWGDYLLQHSSKVISISDEETSECFIRGLDAKHIKQLANGVDLTEYDNLPDGGNFRNKYSIGKSPLVLFIGRLHKDKGLDRLLSAIHILRNVKLAIVGPNAGYGKEVRDIVGALKLSDRVVFTGPLYKRDKLAAYAAADVVVLPSYFETFPLVRLEAWAAKRPVVMAVGNQSVPLDIAIRDALDNKAQYGAKGRELVEKEYSWPLIAGQFETVYKECLS